MTERYRASDYAELMATRTASGRSLSDIAESAIEKATKPSVQACRYSIGLDPGVNCGIAVYDRQARKFALVSSTDFWGAFDIVRAYQLTETRIVVEVAHHAPTFRHLKAQGQNANTLSKIARNVGQVTREAQLLAEGLRRLGYQVIEKAPLGKKKGADGNYSAEADRREFEQLTGWTARTNQHARDAARLALLA